LECSTGCKELDQLKAQHASCKICRQPDQGTNSSFSAYARGGYQRHEFHNFHRLGFGGAGLVESGRCEPHLLLLRDLISLYQLIIFNIALTHGAKSPLLNTIAAGIV
jgi:hypothetical protein